MKLQSLNEAQDMYIVTYQPLDEYHSAPEQKFFGPFNKADAEKFAARWEQTMRRNKKWMGPEFDSIVIIRLRTPSELEYRPSSGLTDFNPYD